MRQVPLNKPLERSASTPADFYPLLLGRGKLARHLHHYFHLIDFQHKHYDLPIRDELGDEEIDRKLKAVNAIWIMVSDQAIAPVLEKVKKRLLELGEDPNRYHFVHSSAATEVAGMSTLHPLMSFGESLYSIEQYRDIPFAIFDGENKSKPLPYPLPNPHFWVPQERRALYHACAVMMSNLPVLLWSEVAKTVERKLDAHTDVFHPILKQTLDNFIAHGASALTGPIARNDQATIDKNLQAIEGTPLHSIYQSFLLLKNSTGGSL